MKWPFKRKQPIVAPVNPAPSDAPRTTLTTVVARSANFTGDLALTEGAAIDGTVEGSVTLHGDAVLLISPTGIVKGRASAARIIVYGLIDGQVSAASLLIRKGAKVSGKASYENLAIEEGAELSGQVSKTQSDEANVLPIDPLRAPRPAETFARMSAEPIAALR